MFLTDCPTCGLRELRGVRGIELLVNTGLPGRGIDVVYRCTRCATSIVVGGADPRTAAQSLSAA